jgi:hypothetical protein
MTSKTLALVAITTQLILGLVLVAILITLQGQNPPKPDYVGCYHGNAAGQWEWVVPCPA